MELVILYRDLDCNQSWDSTPYLVQFKGTKARVINYQPFAVKKSRFNKLTLKEDSSIGYKYALKVNGKQTFFISKYKIN